MKKKQMKTNLKFSIFFITIIFLSNAVFGYSNIVKKNSNFNINFFKKNLDIIIINNTSYINLENFQYLLDSTNKNFSFEKIDDMNIKIYFKENFEKNIIENNNILDYDINTDNVELKNKIIYFNELIYDFNFYKIENNEFFNLNELCSLFDIALNFYDGEYFIDTFTKYTSNILKNMYIYNKENFNYFYFDKKNHYSTVLENSYKFTKNNINNNSFLLFNENDYYLNIKSKISEQNLYLTIKNEIDLFIKDIKGEKLIKEFKVNNIDKSILVSYIENNKIFCKFIFANNNSNTIIIITYSANYDLQKNSLYNYTKKILNYIIYNLRIYD